MKPTIPELQAQCPDLPLQEIREHLARLDDNYFAVFSPSQVCAHLQAMHRLRPEHPVELIFEPGPEDQCACTILAFDYPAVFSLITGVLSAMGFNILSGDVFTYARLPAQTRPPQRSRAVSRRKIIDRFCGAISHHLPPEEWRAEFGKRLGCVIGLLETNTGLNVRDAWGMAGLPGSGRRRALPERAADDPGQSGGQARQKVNEMVAGRLAELDLDSLPALYPVNMEVHTIAGYTRLRVLAQDTPVFLYAMSTALSLQGVSIERVRIRTLQGRVEDEIDVLGADGQALRAGSAGLDRIRLAVLLTKQFTYFVGNAPDPYTALCRFEQMVDAVLKLPERGQWIEMFSNPRTLQDLARLLGTSDFVWEDFVRLQYEALLPVLQPHVTAHRFAHPAAEQESDLKNQLGGAEQFEEQCRRLNAFKDRELFLIDLDHILHPAVFARGAAAGQDEAKMVGVRAFAEELTTLAELVIRVAADIAWRRLKARFGIPRTVGGLEARWALFGLGKFGGVAMGYASDIEVLFVYSDNGRTDGREVIENSEYFDRFVRLLVEIVKAKREGIFHVDTRLRPYGASGPMACSLESFCHYYGPGSRAQAYERLAMVRLRLVGGDAALGGQVERLRDEFVYSVRDINVRELRELRARQLAEKDKPGCYNAKYSPGALVDLEYDVQILQVLHGNQSPGLRTPRLHEALAALSGLGILGRDESERLAAAYYFLRRLINGLRMLRGSARDLFLPPEGSDEFAHLARRMGYERGGELEPEQRLRVDFETHTAIVRAFVERHFGRDSLPGAAIGNVADLVLSEKLPPDLQDRILTKAGFQDTLRSSVNLRKLAGPQQRELFAPLAVLACDFLRRNADPDMALNNWERFARSLPDLAAHFRLLLSQPRRLEILMGIFSTSQFLSDTLIRNPEFFDWATSPEVLHAERARVTIEADLRAFIAGYPPDQKLNGLRRFRRREILRIGTRDICLHAPIEDITAALSAIAEASIRLALEWAWESAGAGAEHRLEKDGFCILAFGKLGGRELNYSSDVDLLGVCVDALPGQQRLPVELFAGVLKQVARDLSAHSEEGHAYRVDFRLRPYGGAGQLVYPVAGLADYYTRKAALWEIQALLKARPVAGSDALGAAFQEKVRSILMQPRPVAAIVRSIGTMRGTAVLKADNRRRLAHRSPDLFESRDAGRTTDPPSPERFGGQATGNGPEMLSDDVKNGPGGIRDVEFLVQALQLIHAPGNGDLLEGNTLSALERLKAHGLLPEETAAQLRRDYSFLRRVEHTLQIFEDRQIHAVPESVAARIALARRMLGRDSTAEEFAATLAACQQRVHAVYVRYLPGAEP